MSLESAVASLDRSNNDSDGLYVQQLKLTLTLFYAICTKLTIANSKRN